MSRLESWPALRGLVCPDHGAPLRAERGTWGKVHGASSDFRWIAATPGFASLTGRPEDELSLGAEGSPVIFGLWRAGGETLLAARCHPSRAVDASGRSGTLEKQVLACSRRADLPVAAAAALLLPHAERLDDGAWWGAAPVERWEEDPGYVHTLPAPLEIPVSRAAVDASIDAALRSLRGWVDDQGGEDLLAALYAGLLTARSPVLHGSDQQPLPTPAIAAFLLPLDRPLADRLSIAAWLPSTRRPSDRLGELWDLLVHDLSLGPPAEMPDVPRETAERALAMARAVVCGDPDALGSSGATDSAATGYPLPPAALPARDHEPDRSAPAEPGWIDPAAWRPPELPEAAVADFPTLLDLPAPPSTSEAWRLLHEFARDPAWRWLAPEQLAGSLRREPVRTDLESVRALAGWIHTLEASPPAGVSPEQWRTKVDLLRAAAVALLPGGETARLVGRPCSHEVSLAFYADAFVGMGALGTR